MLETQKYIPIALVIIFYLWNIMNIRGTAVSISCSSKKCALYLALNQQDKKDTDLEVINAFLMNVIILLMEIMIFRWNTVIN